MEIKFLRIIEGKARRDKMTKELFGEKFHMWMPK